MSDDAEREYVEAKAAYDAALVRLSAAKKARPKQTTKYELREAQNQRIRDAVWQEYLGGQRDYHALGKEFGRSTAWVGSHIREIMHQRRFGPETLREYEERKWLEEYPLRQKAERERREDFARVAPPLSNRSQAQRRHGIKRIRCMKTSERPQSSRTSDRCAVSLMERWEGFL